MTPLGEHLRHLRAERGITQKEMAAGIGVSPAYLSALEHGHRGLPSWPLLQRIVGYFNVIWDDAQKLEELMALSDPRVAVDTVDSCALATRVANRMARRISDLDEDQLRRIEGILKE